MFNNKNYLKKFSLPTAVFFFINIILAKKALAVCPVCAVAAGAGIGFSRWLGIDDSITGIWIGGLTVSLITWTDDWMEKKKIFFPGRFFANLAVYFLLLVPPLYFSGFIGRPENAFSVLGIDKLLWGIIVGALTFWFAVVLHSDLKRKNKNHSYFPFQKVVIPVVLMIIVSLIFYFFNL